MGNMQTGYSDFDVYIVASEPHKWEQAVAWKVAISLLTVDRKQDYRRRITEGS